MTLPGFKKTTTTRSIILDAAVQLAFSRLEGKYLSRKLEEIASISSGGTPSRSDSTFYGGDIPWAKISDITAAGKWISETEEYITQSAIEQSSAKLFPVGTVLFSMYGSIGKTSITKRQITTNQAILGLFPLDDISSEFLYYALIDARVSLFSQSKGTSQKNINGGMVKDFEIAVPPAKVQQKIVEFLSLIEDGKSTDQIENLPDYLVETRRIVTYIESLALRIDEAQRLRKGARSETEAFVASVQNALFLGQFKTDDVKSEESATGLLTDTLRNRRIFWEEFVRAKGKDPSKAKYEEPQPITIDDLPTLPDDWSWVTWDMILAFEDGAFRRGPFGSTLRKSIFVESGYKVYEQYCPINDDCSYGRYYIAPELFKKLKSFEVKAGDFLISCSGVTLGRITQVPQGSDEGIINQALLRVRINNKIIDDKYFLYCFRAPFFQKLLFVNSTGSAIPNLKGVKELKAIPMPLPPLDEQRRIVAYLDSVQARLRSLRELQSQTGEELDALLPSVLDKAFKGEL